MLKAMTTYKASLENAKDSFDAIVATGDLIMNMIEASVANPTMYDEAKKFSHGNPTDFIIYLLTNTDLDMYKAIDKCIFLCTRIYFVDFEDALNAVLTFDIDTVNSALRAPEGLQARNLRIYAGLFTLING